MTRYPRGAQPVREILLVRHGRPVIDARTRIHGAEFMAWVRDYDQAPLDAGLPPPEELRRRAESVGCIATSTLRRSRESAALLTSKPAAVSESVFDEAATSIPFSFPFAFSPNVWDVIATGLWFRGLSRAKEPVVAARARAALASEALVRLARENGSVMLVGHGAINTLIFKHLRSAGWRGSWKPRTYWSLISLTRGE